MTWTNPLQNYNARFETTIAQSMPSDFEEIVTKKQIVWKRELGLVFRHAQLAETVKRSILLHNYQYAAPCNRNTSLTCSVMGS